MPLGTLHDETGVLSQGPFGLALDVGGGGAWRLDTPFWMSVNRHLGRRVRIRGERIGFDELRVRKIEPF